MFWNLSLQPQTSCLSSHPHPQLPLTISSPGDFQLFPPDIYTLLVIQNYNVILLQPCEYKGDAAHPAKDQRDLGWILAIKVRDFTGAPLTVELMKKIKNF